MRRIRYQVATSLDGFIADQDDGYGWINERDFKDYLESIPWPADPDFMRDIRQR